MSQEMLACTKREGYFWTPVTAAALAGMDAGDMTDICCAYRAHTSAAETCAAGCVESTGSHAVPSGIPLAYCEQDPLIANMHQHRACTVFDSLTLKQLSKYLAKYRHGLEYNYLAPSVETRPLPLMRSYSMKLVCLFCDLLLCLTPEATQAYVDGTTYRTYHWQTCRFASCLDIVNFECW